MTLSIRIYGVDCPELAKTKSQTSQPYAQTAKAFTERLCLHKVVRVTLLRRDQYGRAVAVVRPVRPWFLKPLSALDVSVELAKAGLAELYTGGGAQYWTKREELEQHVKNAQRRKKGIWSLGPQHMSAAEHKKQQKLLPLGDQTNRDETKKTKTTTKKNSKPADRKKKPKKKKASTALETAITGLEAFAV